VKITEDDIDKDYVGMANCFVCGEVKHLLLDKRLRKSLPRNAVYDKIPCDKCQEVMKEGVIFVGVRDGEQDKENPYRTGQIIGVREEAVKKIIKPSKLLDEILKKRVCFIEEAVLKKMGLIGERGALKFPKKSFEDFQKNR
jgi:hypothetical protein